MRFKLIWFTGVLLLKVFGLVSQNSEARVQEIKKMYAEAQQLQKAENAANCKTEVKTTYESFDAKSEKIPFEQSAKSCELAKGYKVISADLKGYEWGRKWFFYYKDTKLFFVFNTGGAEACYSEYRIYYDNNGGVIKLLEKSNNCDGAEATKNTELKNDKDKKTVLTMVDDDLKTILDMLKK